MLMSDLVSTFPLWFCNNCTSIVINTPINAVIALNEIGAGNSANVEACKYNRVLDQHWKLNRPGYEEPVYLLEGRRWWIRQRQLREGRYIPRLCLDQTRILKHYLFHLEWSKRCALSSLSKRRTRTTMSLRSSVCCTRISYSSSPTCPREQNTDTLVNVGARDPTLFKSDLNLTIQAIKKMRPGARLGIAVAIAGDVNLIPSRNRDWNRVTLFISKQIQNFSIVLYFLWQKTNGGWYLPCKGDQN